MVLSANAKDWNVFSKLWENREAAHWCNYFNKNRDRNGVIVIEIILDVIKTADWIIDLGPEGGHSGGRIVAQGATKMAAKNTASYTGQYLKEILPQ
jgi:excinuclease UvrABC ATPase subunit